MDHNTIHQKLYDNSFAIIYVKFWSREPANKMKKEGRKEGIVLFNDTRNTFYLRLYGVRHMVKDHSDSDSGNLLLPHGLLFPISSKGSLYASSHNTYHSLCYTSRGALVGSRKAQWFHHEGSI